MTRCARLACRILTTKVSNMSKTFTATTDAGFTINKNILDTTWTCDKCDTKGVRDLFADAWFDADAHVWMWHQ